MRPEVINPCLVGGHVDDVIHIERFAVFFTIFHREATIGVVEIDDESHGDGGSGQQGVTPKEIPERVSTACRSRFCRCESCSAEGLPGRGFNP